MDRDRLTALAVTASCGIALTAVLLMCRLTFDSSMLPPSRQPVAEVAEIDEDFVDFLDTRSANSTPSKAYTPEPASGRSQAADASGSHVADAGARGAAVPDVTSERPSPVQRPKKEPAAPAGPSRQEQEAEARRKVRKGIADAFAPRPEANDNTDNSRGSDKGDSGAPDGEQSTLNGIGEGSVGGGWIMPRFAKVTSHTTGSIRLQATVDSYGHVTAVDFVGGQAPASTDAALIERCKAEVRKRRFTRTDDNAPQRATARITYRFK